MRRLQIELRLCLLLLSLTLPLSAQTTALSVGDADIAMRFGATAQIRGSYGHDDVNRLDRLGFGIRRLRLRLYTDIGPNVLLFTQAEGANNTLSILDFALGYRVNSHIQVRMGRMIMAQPAAFGLTIHYNIDSIDRPVIASDWAAHTIGADGRDFGLEARLTYSQIRARIAIHNGDGHWDRIRGNYREEITMGSPTSSLERTSIAVSGALAWHPVLMQGLEIGGFMSYNGARSPYTAYLEQGRTYVSYAAHLYWGALPGSQPIRIKADIIGIDYATVEAFREQRRGASLFAAIRLTQASELFSRIEYLDPNRNTSSDACAFLVGGISFSPSAQRGLAYARERITLGYSSRYRDATSGSREVYGLVLQAQVMF